MRQIDFRLEVLRNGVPFTRLLYSSPPTVYADSDAAIKWSLRGSFLHNPAVDYITDELRPMLLIDGAEYPAGVYRFVTRKESHTQAGTIYENVEAFDRAILLRWAKLETRDFWAAGTSYDEIISHYLIGAGITHVAATPSSHVLQSDREDWDIGTSYLDIVNALLSEINYQSVWFDDRGVAHIAPYAALTADNIQHTYTDSAVVLRPELSSEIDIYDKPNVFIAILENPEYPEPLYATAVNDTPGSQLSTIRRGLRIPAVRKVSNIASQEELQTYINKVRDESMWASEIVDIQTPIMPGHTVGNVIALVHGDTQGIFREKRWSFTLETGAYMTHKLQRVVMI